MNWIWFAVLSSLLYYFREGGFADCFENGVKFVLTLVTVLVT